MRNTQTSQEKKKINFYTQAGTWTQGNHERKKGGKNAQGKKSGKRESLKTQNTKALGRGRSLKKEIRQKKARREETGRGEELFQTPEV